MDKKKRVTLISVVGATVLLAVLLFALLSGGITKNDPDNDTPGTSDVGNPDSEVVGGAVSNEDKDKNQIEIDIDVGEDDEEDKNKDKNKDTDTEEEQDDNMVIDFDDLLAAAGM